MQRYASLLGLQTADVGSALESIRVQAVNRGKGNKKFRDMNMATLELLLPRDGSKVRTPALDEYRQQEITFIQKKRPTHRAKGFQSYLQQGT